MKDNFFTDGFKDNVQKREQRDGAYQEQPILLLQKLRNYKIHQGVKRKYKPKRISQWS